MSQQWNRSINTMDRARSNKSNQIKFQDCMFRLHKLLDVPILNEIFFYSTDSLGSQAYLLPRLSVLLSLDSVLAS
jgi:hypothetical protein